MWLVLSRHDCIFKRDWVSVLQVARLSGLIPHLKLQYRYLHAIGHALEVLMYFQITALSASSLLFIVSMNELCLDVMYRNAFFCFRNTCSIIRRALGLSVLITVIHTYVGWIFTILQHRFRTRWISKKIYSMRTLIRHSWVHCTVCWIVK